MENHIHGGTRATDGDIDDQGHVRYKTVQPFFEVPSLPNHSALRQFHREGLKLATEAVDKPSEVRKCYATFLAMNSQQFVQFQELIQDFNRRLLALCESTELGEKKIYRFNAQIFPAS